MSLPIYELESALTESLTSCPRLILQAPTGSGKSTQVPQILLRAGFAEKGEIVVLQPRRLPARMLAARVAREMNVRLGEEVGYQIRFEDITGPKTKIRFITEGLLLRQILSDPTLRNTSVILFDEFHERNLSTDISLAIARQTQRTTRPDLKLIAMSATLADSSALSEYLSPCRTLESQGRAYPVEISHLEREPDLSKMPIWELAAGHAEVLTRKHEGDALIFMPGVYEIQRTIETLRGRLGSKDFEILPLYGELSPQQQDAAMNRSEKRKIVVATNVAETSLTIDGVRIILDSGLARVARYDPNRGLDTLWIEKISRASADQRSGRAGRIAPGVCLRLWTERDHQARQDKTPPEIHRVDLSETVLLLHAAGYGNVRAFPWFESPDADALRHAEEILSALGALSGDGRTLTKIGRRMSEFPLHPRFSRMLLAAENHGCVEKSALFAALAQERSILRRPTSKSDDQFLSDMRADHPNSDLELLATLWERAAAADFDPRACERFLVHAGSARQVDRALRQFLSIAKRLRLKTDAENPPPETLRKCLLLAFPDRIALRLDGGTLRCRLADGRVVELDRDSAVRNSRLLLAVELREVMNSQKNLRTVLVMASAVESSWLEELEKFQSIKTVEYDEETRRVVARQKTLFGQMVLETKELPPPSPDEAAPILAAKVIDGSCKLKEWNDEVEQWITRVNCLAGWIPEISIPPIRPEDRKFLIEQVCQGALSYKEIKDKPVLPVIQGWLSREHRDALDSLAPARFELPGNFRARITYREGNAPVLSAKIQQLYGVERSLTIAGGKVKLLLEILAPNFRPVQVTDDLVRFWKETYPQLRPELQRRYPRHLWK